MTIGCGHVRQVQAQETRLAELKGGATLISPEERAKTQKVRELGATAMLPAARRKLKLICSGSYSHQSAAVAPVLLLFLDCIRGPILH